MPPCAWIGFESGCTTSPSGSGGSRSARFSAIVLPVTVRQSPCSSPASSSSSSRPARRRSGRGRPCGTCRAASCRRCAAPRAPTRLKSSSSSSTRASCAIASRCSTAFVEPPSAIATAIAFSNASLVMIWRGRRSSSSRRMTARPLSYAKSSRRRSTAGGDAEPGSDMPIASPTDAIVLAVNMPAHDPSVGHARISISPSSFSVIVPAAHAPTASNTRHDVERLVLVVAGQDRAAVEEHRRQVEPRRGHQHAGQALVAAGERDAARRTARRASRTRPSRR